MLLILTPRRKPNLTKFRYDSARENILPRALLVSVAIGRTPFFDKGEEISELARSDALEVVGLIQARRDKPDPATLLGSGKVEEIRELAKTTSADVVIFDATLTAAQERNLARSLEIGVMDRTELILSIFERRAKGGEGKLQVELAKLVHLSTRLVRGWTHLERQRGGLSKTGGPGEKQIELDRRLIAARVKQLKAQLKKLARQRDTRRQSRSEGSTLTVSLVGYTNAGKSTLFNALTRSEVYAANQLFATLDTTARRCWIGENESIVLSDTVGFIRGLPHQLIDAFKSTLEETIQADVLLHIVDASNVNREEQIESVNNVLEEIGASEIPVITVFNKIDLSGHEASLVRDNETGAVKAIFLSATTGVGFDLLRLALREYSEGKKKREVAFFDERNLSTTSV